MSKQNTRSTSALGIQITVFALVAAAFTNIYITQPVLTVLQQEFASDLVHVSFTVSAVFLGLALTTLPFGVLVDRLPIRPIVVTGAIIVAGAGILGSFTKDLDTLIWLRFVQGLFIPALTSSLAAFLAKSLPADRLSIVMGSYVAATVFGGLGGRLIGGWIHTPLHWRYALLSAAALLIIAMIIALFTLPRGSTNPPAQKTTDTSARINIGDILKRWDLWRSFLTAFGAFSVFSSLFNYLPFRLSNSPCNLSIDWITAIYLVYIIGLFMGPLSGRLVNRYGGGKTLLAGSALMMMAVVITLAPSLIAIIVGLFVLCAGFFTIHAAAVGALNRRLSNGQGRANALYMLFYYAGGWVGVSLSGLAYDYAGWQGMILFCLLMLLLPVVSGIGEMRDPIKPDNNSPQNG